MAPYPVWYEDSPDWAEDKNAHDEVTHRNLFDAQSLHRAVRHHNWLQEDFPVRGWTSQPHKQSQSLCWQETWTNLSPVPSNGTRQLVTHRLVASLKNVDLEKLVLDNRNDPGELLIAARQWHQRESSLSSPKAIWLGDRSDVESKVPFVTANLHNTVSILGLWHFGYLPADREGAVIRLVYEVGDDVPLYKPDWRHGYANFYWASVSSIPEHGMTRDLSTGTLQCKEWVARLDQLDARKHLKAAQCLVPEAAHSHYDLTDAFWHQLKLDICGGAAGTTGAAP